MVLSDNPAGRYGPSVELGWSYTKGNKHGKHIVAFEKEQKEKRQATASKPRRLYLSPFQRDKLLRDANYSSRDINKALREKNRIRRQRLASNFFQNPLLKIENALKTRRRNKKLKRAVQNLNNKKMRQSSLFVDNSTLYRGWLLQF